MINFFGEFRFSIDDKGRTALPASFRDTLENEKEDSEHWVITKGMEQSILLYPIKIWQQLLEYLSQKLSYKNEADRTFLRYFIFPAKEVTVDKQGRFVIPKNLIDHAKIAKNVVFLGALNKIEIWSEDYWEGYISNSSDQLSQLISRLDDLNL
jgi:MraZ protein